MPFVRRISKRPGCSWTARSPQSTERLCGGVSGFRVTINRALQIGDSWPDSVASALAEPERQRHQPGQPHLLLLQLRDGHGDPTDAHAQVAARQDLGLKARFRTDGRIEHLIEQLEQGIPCPVGRLHTGLVIGWDRVQCQFLMLDPNGEGDLVNGGYVIQLLAVARRSPISSATGGGAGWWRIQINNGSGSRQREQW